MTRHKRAGLAVVLIGVVVLGGALAQPAKAHLGRGMLEATFSARLAAPEAARADASQWRPWSWAAMSPIGEIRFPALGESRIIVDSSSGEALAWAVGHVPETSPLGTPGPSVIAGHRDGTFSLLADVSEGDVIEVTTLANHELRYVVEHQVVVDADHYELPIERHGDDELVLATCWPIDALVTGSERLLIRARLIS